MDRAVFLMTDADLISKAVAGCKASFEILWMRHRHFIKMLALRITRDATDAEDAMQDAAVMLCRKLSTFRRESHFRTWLHTLVTNCSYMLLRRKRKHAMPNDELVQHVILDAVFPTPDDVEDGFGYVARKQLGARISKAVGELRPDYRKLFITYRLEDHTLAETAKLSKRSLPSFKSAIHRANQDLYYSLKAMGVSEAGL